MADVALQRKNMVESQVRPSDVTDQRIIRAMLEIPREMFVPEASASVAYADSGVRLDAAGVSAGQQPRTLMAPRVFAKMLQLCEIEPHDDVLIIGAGAGYSAAVIARLAKSVTALESDAALIALAQKALARDGAGQVDVISGPLWVRPSTNCDVSISGMSAVQNTIGTSKMLMRSPSFRGVGLATRRPFKNVP